MPLQIAFGRRKIVLRVTLMGWELFLTFPLYWVIDQVTLVTDLDEIVFNTTFEKKQSAK